MGYKEAISSQIKKLPVYLRKLKNKLRSFRGSSRDPLLYLVLISVILFLLTTFTPWFLRASKEAFLASISNPLTKTNSQYLFLSQNKSFYLESPELILVQGSSLKAATPSLTFSPQVLGSLIGSLEGLGLEENRKGIIEYVVEPGDTFSSIAKKFDISIETLLWANNLNHQTLIRPGQKLIVLPVSGVMHQVRAGDTLNKIAKKYKGKVDEIVAFNDLSSEEDIYIGDILIIPGGKLPKTPNFTPTLAPLAQSYFICPIPPPCRITYGLHWYNAVDLSNGKCGEPIYAAAAGKVLKVKLTNSRSPSVFGGAGNHLTILHPNGAISFYGHIQTSLVNPGDQVSQGDIIALMGGQPGTPGAGRSTGCHLHFGVIGAKNPFAQY